MHLSFSDIETTVESSDCSQVFSRKEQSTVIEEIAASVLELNMSGKKQVQIVRGVQSEVVGARSQMQTVQLQLGAD